MVLDGAYPWVWNRDRIINHGQEEQLEAHGDFFWARHVASDGEWASSGAERSRTAEATVAVARAVLLVAAKAAPRAKEQRGELGNDAYDIGLKSGVNAVAEGGGGEWKLAPAGQL
jgi:hypothetical protein